MLFNQHFLINDDPHGEIIIEFIDVSEIMEGTEDVQIYKVTAYCIDVFFDTHQEALNFGIKYLEVEIVQ